MSQPRSRSVSVPPVSHPLDLIGAHVLRHRYPQAMKAVDQLKAHRKALAKGGSPAVADATISHTMATALVRFEEACADERKSNNSNRDVAGAFIDEIKQEIRQQNSAAPSSLESNNDAGLEALLGYLRQKSVFLHCWKQLFLPPMDAALREMSMMSGGGPSIADVVLPAAVDPACLPSDTTVGGTTHSLLAFLYIELAPCIEVLRCIVAAQEAISTHCFTDMVLYIHNAMHALSQYYTALSEVDAVIGAPTSTKGDERIILTPTLWVDNWARAGPATPSPFVRILGTWMWALWGRITLLFSRLTLSEQHPFVDAVRGSTLPLEEVCREEARMGGGGGIPGANASSSSLGSQGGASNSAGAKKAKGFFATLLNRNKNPKSESTGNFAKSPPSPTPMSPSDGEMGRTSSIATSRAAPPTPSPAPTMVSDAETMVILRRTGNGALADAFSKFLTVHPKVGRNAKCVLLLDNTGMDTCWVQHDFSIPLDDDVPSGLRNWCVAYAYPSDTGQDAAGEVTRKRVTLPLAYQALDMKASGNDTFRSDHDDATAYYVQRSRCFDKRLFLCAVVQPQLSVVNDADKDVRSHLMQQATEDLAGDVMALLRDLERQLQLRSVVVQAQHHIVTLNPALAAM